MKILTQYEQIDKQQWSELVEQSPVTSIFQTEACYRFYASLSFLDAFVYGVEENKQLKAIMVGYVQADGGKIKRFLSRRAIVNGGLLLAADVTNEEIMALLSAAKRELRKKAIYIELRNLKDFSSWQPTIQNAGYKYEEHLGYIVNTPSEEEVLMNMEKRRRQTIRAALREGAEIDMKPSYEDLIAYYAILENMYKTRIKLPLYPFEFFEKLSHQPFGRFFIIKYNGEVIGGQTSLCLDGKTIYDIYVSGRDKEFKKQSPSTLAVYASLQYAGNNDYAQVDLMGAGKPGEKYGVRDFKESFHGSLVSYGRNHYICHPILYIIGKLGVKLLSVL